MSGLDAALLTGGVLFVVETIKALVPWRLAPGSKLFLAVAAASGGAALLDLSWRYAVVVVPGTAGLAALLHRLHRLLGVVGDQHMINVLAADAKAKRRR